MKHFYSWLIINAQAYYMLPKYLTWSKIYEASYWLWECKFITMFLVNWLPSQVWSDFIIGLYVLKTVHFLAIYNLMLVTVLLEWGQYAFFRILFWDWNYFLLRNNPSTMVYSIFHKSSCYAQLPFRFDWKNQFFDKIVFVLFFNTLLLDKKQKQALWHVWFYC